jgi:hypothetical protein
VLARDLRDVRGELDFPRKIRRSFRRNTAVWVAVVVVVGVAIAIRPARKKKIYVEPKVRRGQDDKTKLLSAGFALGALRIAMTLLKPVLLKFVAQKMGNFAGASRTTRKW